MAEVKDAPETTTVDPPKETPYDKLVKHRLEMLHEDYKNYPNPDYLEEGESKLVPFIMSALAELFVRSDIVMDQINAMNTPQKEGSADEPDRS
jgi:hypothetical protein